MSLATALRPLLVALRSGDLSVAGPLADELIERGLLASPELLWVRFDDVDQGERLSTLRRQRQSGPEGVIDLDVGFQVAACEFCSDLCRSHTLKWDVGLMGVPMHYYSAHHCATLFRCGINGRAVSQDASIWLAVWLLTDVCRTYVPEFIRGGLAHLDPTPPPTPGPLFDSMGGSIPPKRDPRQRPYRFPS